MLFININYSFTLISRFLIIEGLKCKTYINILSILYIAVAGNDFIIAK